MGPALERDWLIWSANVTNSNTLGAATPVVFAGAAGGSVEDIEFLGSGPGDINNDPGGVYILTDTNLFRADITQTILAGGVPSFAAENFGALLSYPAGNPGLHGGLAVKDLAYNPSILNPFFLAEDPSSTRRGVFLGTDTSTDELLFIDFRNRHPSTDVFTIYATKNDPNGSSTDGKIAISVDTTNITDAALTQNLNPYGSGVSLHVVNRAGAGHRCHHGSRRRADRRAVRRHRHQSSQHLHQLRRRPLRQRARPVRYLQRPAFFHDVARARTDHRPGHQPRYIPARRNHHRRRQHRRLHPDLLRRRCRHRRRQRRKYRHIRCRRHRYTDGFRRAPTTLSLPAISPSAETSASSSSAAISPPPVAANAVGTDYSAGTDLLIGGRVGEIHVAGNSGATGVIKGSDIGPVLPGNITQREIEFRGLAVGLRNGATGLDFAQFKISPEDGMSAFVNDTQPQYLGTINSTVIGTTLTSVNNVVQVRGLLQTIPVTYAPIDTTDNYAVGLLAGQTYTFQLLSLAAFDPATGLESDILPGDPTTSAQTDLSKLGYATVAQPIFLELIDPDGHVVATDSNDVDLTQTQQRAPSATKLTVPASTRSASPATSAASPRSPRSPTKSAAYSLGKYAIGGYRAPTARSTTPA